MPIDQLQFTNPQAYSGGADFTPLAGLYDVYKKSQERAMQEQALSQLGPDPIANARTLTQSGTLPLAQLGLGMQDKEILRRREDIANQQAQQNFMLQQKLREQEAARSGSYLTIAQQQAERAARKEAEDTPEARGQKMDALGIAKDDPNYIEYKLTGQNPPSLLQRQQAAQKQYELEQAQKYDTREKRLQAVKDGELDINDPAIRRWVALGSKDNEPPDIAKGRLGMTPLYIQNDTTGEVKAVQLRNDQPTETPPGWTLLGPGQIARQKAEGMVTGKATGAAKVALPRIVDTGLEQVGLIDEILAHPGRMYATGALSVLPTAPGTPQADFRSRFGQITGNSFLSIYEQLRGAGQITNIEGDKGTAAANRMNAATTEKEFDAAAKDAKELIKLGIERSQRAAQGDFSLHPKVLQDLQTKLGVGAPGTAPAAPTVPASDPLTKARAAIQNGADPKAVRQRLIDAKINPGDIGL